MKLTFFKNYSSEVSGTETHFKTNLKKRQSEKCRLEKCRWAVLWELLKPTYHFATLGWVVLGPCRLTSNPET